MSDKAITVKELREDTASLWDAFVGGCPEATFFHRAGWKNVIEKAFGHRTYYLYAEQHGDIVGVLPLGYVKSMLFGRSLISLPFCVYGGVAAQNDMARAALEDAAVQLAEDLRVGHLEARNRGPRRADWVSNDLYVTFRKEISPDPDENMRAIPRKQRAMVRKGIKAGLTAVEDEDVDRLFEMYALSVRNLGTPVFPEKYFRALKEEFGPDCRILTVSHRGRPVSSVMSFYFRDEVLPYYGGGDASARSLKANDFMYWELMRKAAFEGVRIFDYGRSKKGSGSFSFKKNWGFEPEPLYYEYHLVTAKRVPDLNPYNPKYRFLIGTWRRLPVKVTKRLGPYIARNLG